jgi:hypothetical protein
MYFQINYITLHYIYIIYFKYYIILQILGIYDVVLGVVAGGCYMSSQCTIGLIIEDQAFSPSYDLAPPPPFPPSHSPVRNTDKERQFADGRGGGDWGGAKFYDREKAWLY